MLCPVQLLVYAFYEQGSLVTVSVCWSDMVYMYVVDCVISEIVFKFFVSYFNLNFLSAISISELWRLCRQRSSTGVFLFPAALLHSMWPCSILM